MSHLVNLIWITSSISVIWSSQCVSLFSVVAECSDWIVRYLINGQEWVKYECVKFGMAFDRIAKWRSHCEIGSHWSSYSELRLDLNEPLWEALHLSGFECFSWSWFMLSVSRSLISKLMWEPHSFLGDVGTTQHMYPPSRHCIIASVILNKYHLSGFNNILGNLLLFSWQNSFIVLVVVRQTTLFILNSRLCSPGRPNYNF